MEMTEAERQEWLDKRERFLANVLGFAGAFGIGLGVTAAFVRVFSTPRKLRREDLKNLPQAPTPPPVPIPLTPNTRSTGINDLVGAMGAWLQRAQVMTNKLGLNWLANPGIEATTDTFLTPEGIQMFFGPARQALQQASNQADREQIMQRLLDRLTDKYRILQQLEYDFSVRKETVRPSTYTTQNGPITLQANPKGVLFIAS